MRGEGTDGRLAAVDGSRGTKRYAIVVKGQLGARVSSAFEGMDVAAEGTDTRLEGDADQARLLGVLQQLQDFGIELLSVNELQSWVTAGAGPGREAS
jgi:hypothetical protein